MKIDLNIAPSSDPLTRRQVIILTEKQDRKLREYARSRGLGISALLRNVVDQIVDYEENAPAV